jgi:hypothetical protein
VKLKSREDGAPRKLRDSLGGSGKPEVECAAARHPHRYQTQILRDLPEAQTPQIVHGSPFPRATEFLIYKNSIQYQKLLWFIIFAPLAYQTARCGRAESQPHAPQGRQPLDFQRVGSRSDGAAREALGAMGAR